MNIKIIEKKHNVDMASIAKIAMELCENDDDVHVWINTSNIIANTNGQTHMQFWPL